MFLILPLLEDLKTMVKLTKRFCEEMCLFLKQGKRRRIVYNQKCKECIHECKQGYRVEIVACKKFKGVNYENK